VAQKLHNYVANCLHPPFLFHLGKFSDIYRQITMKMTTRSLLSSVAIGVAALTQFTSPASAITLINETFGSGNPDRFNVSSAVGTFAVTSGNIDLIGNGGSFDFYTGNGNYIDLNGNTGGTITSTSSFTFNPGESATLSFDYGTNGVGTSADIFFGGNLIGSLLTPSGGSSFTPFNLTFNNPGSGALSFVSTNAGGGGIVLDNIQLSSNPASVPEPSDMLGTAIAFGSIVMLKRKLTKKTLG
jgi:hypothetical protein